MEGNLYQIKYKFYPLGKSLNYSHEKHKKRYKHNVKRTRVRGYFGSDF